MNISRKVSKHNAHLQTAQPFDDNPPEPRSGLTGAPTMQDRFNAHADIRKVKAALNRTITLCRRTGLFNLSREAVRAKLTLRRAAGN